MENCNAFIALWASVVLLYFGVLNVVVESSHAVREDIKLEGTPTPSIAFGETRTGYHFQPPKNWINDPNGPMYYNGIYHLFYQYNPKGAVWQDGIIWGHSVSTDLINWTPLEPAIRPSKPFDHEGCWSGSATIISGNKPIILYTGIDSDKRQVQNIAVPKNLSDPYLREWIKPDRNPLIVPTGWINSSAFRDPTTAWSGPDGYWRVAIGSKHNSRGMAILYRSKDFEKWVKVKHPLHSVKGSGMWECPDFYPVSSEGKKGCNTSGSECGKGTKHIFKVSLDVTRYEYYTIGTYSHETDRYHPDNTSVDDHTGLRYDYGNFYASKTFFDAKKNRRVLWGWSNESDLASNDVAKGWAGIQTIPRALWLDSNGRQLVQWPVEELETFSGKQVRIHDTLLESGDIREVQGIETAQADVEVIFEVQSLEKAEPFNSSWSDPRELCELKPANVMGGIGPFGLLVLASKSLEEQTAVFFRIFKDHNKHVVLMCQDPTRSSLRPEVYKPIYGGFVDMDIAKSGKISLRSLIDHSVVESFGGGGRTCITSRIYPQVAAGSAAHLHVFNNGTSSLKISELRAWEMRRPRINLERA